ncbi:SCO family protein [Achromobacter piechaudii]|uniref:SCO family protein n=1 Tax=Achromobacter piechaudii TaxID=72556 RepID=UPI003B8A7BF4
MPMVLVFLCSLAPIVAAFVVYMNPQWWPADSSNYGTLVSPQRPMPAANELKLTTLDGKPFDLQSLKGKWLLVAADGAACPESCARKLYITRNTHASQGKNVDRLARVWFITDNEPVPEKVLEAYQGTVMLRVNADQLAHYLLARDSAAGQPALQDPIWVIDPLGNLMMQYPAQADGVKVRKDISKLVYNSRIG